LPDHYLRAHIDWGHSHIHEVHVHEQNSAGVLVDVSKAGMTQEGLYRVVIENETQNMIVKTIIYGVL
jgi:hypothetical protein